MKKWTRWLQVPVICAMLAGSITPAQRSADPSAPSAPGVAPAPPPPAVGDELGSAILEWVPPALAELSTEALAKESFTLDRTMLAAAAGLVPDSDADVRQAVAKLDGVSVHTLRFAQSGSADPARLTAIREAYHLRGWKHVVSSGGSAHDNKTDVWVVMDGTNLRGAVVLVDTPKSLTLATVAGNLSPVDLLHLRGHFGIPRFDSDELNNTGK
jgi:hypothetical protein